MAFKEKLEFLVDVDDKATRKFQQIGKSADDSLKKGTSLGDKFGGAIEKAAAKSPLLSGALDKVGLSATQAGSVLATALPGAALAAGAGIGVFAAKAVGDFQKLGASILDFQRVSGASADDSSRFVAVLDDFEISAEAGATAIGKMAKAAANTPEVFERFGVEIAKNKDGTVDLQGTLLNAAEAYQSTNDSATKAALGAALFGRGYQTLIPILEKGADGAGGLAAALSDVSGQQIMTQEQIDNAERTRLALDRLSDAAHELALMVGSTLSPVLGDAANILSTVTEATNTVLGPIGGFGEAWKHALAPLPAAVTSLDSLADSITGSADLLPGYTNALMLVGEVTEAVSAATAAQGETQDVATAAILSAQAAIDGLTESTNTATDAINTATGAIKGQNDALNEGIDKILGARQANLDYTSAQIGTNSEVAKYIGIMADANATTDERTAAGIALEEQLIEEASKFAESAQATAEANGEMFTARQRADSFNQGLEILKGRFPELATLLDGYKVNLDGIPPTKDTKINLDADDALRVGQSVIDTLARIKDKTVSVNIVRGENQALATGGEVKAPVNAATGVLVHHSEQGPETTVFPEGARVLNRADSIEAARPRVAGPAFVIQNANFYDAVDVDVLAQRVLFAMVRAG